MKRLTPEEKIVSAEKRKAKKKEYDKVHNALPEVKAKQKARNATPEKKEYDKAYRSIPEHKVKHKAYCKTYYAIPENKVANKIKQFKKLYGISIEKYNETFNAQGGKCAICKRPQSEFKLKLSVDHDHNFNENRGLLCHKCNRGLGLFNDNIELLESAIAYKNKYDTGHLMLRRITERRLKIQDLITKAKTDW